MANEVLVKQGTAKTWKQSGGDYALSLNGLTDTSARQGPKGDLGATRAAEYALQLVIDANVAPTDGEEVQVFWAGSPNATAGSENPGGTTGTDAAYSDPTNDSKQLQLVGVMSVMATTSDQYQTFRYRPPYRYGMPVVWNNSGQTLASAGNSLVAVYPITDEIQ